MAIATKRAKRKAKTTPLMEIGELRGQGIDIRLDEIQSSRFNPRKDFAKSEIGELAQSIKAHGLLQPIVVRKVRVRRGGNGKADGFEVVAGERRWRAARAAGLEAIPAVVRELTDRQAREISVLENLQRKDLNAIEEARGFQALLEGDGAPTQTELAARLGVTQGHISNRLRLLKLSAGLQKRIISGEIPATHAREIVPYAVHPKLLSAIEKAVDIDLKRDGGILPVECFRDGTLQDVVALTTRPMQGEQYNVAIGRRTKVFTPTDQERAKLDIVVVPGEFGEGTEQRAINTKLWDKLQVEYAKKEGGRRKAVGGKPKKPKKLTAAVKKRLAAEEARKAKEQARRFAKRLYQWKIDWERYLIANWLWREAQPTTTHRFFLMLVGRWARPDTNLWFRFDRLLTSLCKGNVRSRNGLPDLWAAQQALDDDTIEEIAAKFLAGCFFDEKTGPVKLVPAEDVEQIVKDLEINLENAWPAEQAGPLSEAYWNLHTKPQLVALSRELGKQVKGELPADASKSAAVKWFLDKKPAEDDKEAGLLPLPKEIKRAKRPRQ